MSGNSEQDFTSPSRFDAWLNKIKETKQTVGNRPGYFVSRSLIDKFSEMLSNLDGEFDDEMHAIRQSAAVELAEVRKQLGRAEDGMRDAEDALEDAKNKYTDALIETRNIQSAHDIALEKVGSQKAQIESRLNDLRAEHKELKAHLEACKKQSTHPDEVRAAIEKASAVGQKLDDANQEKQELNRRLNVVKKELNLANKTLKSKNDVLDAAKAQLLQFTSADQAANMEWQTFVKKPAPVVEVNSSAVKKLLGTSGEKWIQKAVQVEHDNIKERVYNLMLAFKSAKKSKAINGFFDLLEVVFSYVKSRAWQTRKKITKWVDELTRDASVGALKSLKYYRDELAKVIDVAKAKAAESAAFVQNKVEHLSSGSWFTDFWINAHAWAWVAARRAKRVVKSCVSGLATVGGKISGWFFGPFYRATSEKETLFEQPVFPNTEQIHMSDNS